MMTDRDAAGQEGESLSRMDGTMNDPEWVVAKSLLEVNNMSTDTLEAFLLYANRNRLDELPAEELAARLDELIEKQTRAVAELELARDAIAGLDDD